LPAFGWIVFEHRVLPGWVALRLRLILSACGFVV
jgi:hypothetical protein